MLNNKRSTFVVGHQLSWQERIQGSLNKSDLQKTQNVRMDFCAG